MTGQDLAAVALGLHDAGCCVLPAAQDGSKRPAVAWQQYQQRRPDRAQLEQWLAAGPAGVGVVCGAVSGGLEMLELEARAVDAGLLSEATGLADACGLGPLWRAVTAGWLERTPSGGMHILVRVDGAPVPPNLKLARRRDAGTGRVEVLAETRGEGGWTVVAPSAGGTHPTGQPWVLLAGGPGKIARISPGDLAALHTLLRTFDQLDDNTGATPQAAAPGFSTTAGGRRDDGGLLPGDDYNQRACWEELLVPRGWRKVFERAGTVYWRRPGKRDGISATSGRTRSVDGADRLYVFSSSTEFDTEVPYSLFGGYALLEHGGDHSKAARALTAAGYGHEPPDPPRPAPAAPTPPVGPAGGGAPAPAVSAAVLPARDAYTATDTGNADRLVDDFGQILRYVPERGQWLVWDGSRWAVDVAGHVQECAKAAVWAIDDGGDPKLAAHKQRSQSRRALEAMVALARTDRRVIAPAATLDARPTELNTPAGVVDLVTGELRPPDPAAMHTRITAVAPDMDGPCRRWEAFLADTFAGMPDVTAYVQRLIGYMVTGRVREHLLPFLHGEGGNGKSQLLEALQKVLGGDYATTAPSSFLMDTRHEQHETEIARLAGARLVICSEVNERDRFDEAKVKLLTGGDRLTARFMRQDHFTFTPTHHLVVMGNHRPAVGSGGHAFWRRVRLVPFLHQVPDDKKIEDLAGVLAAEEGPAILGWIIRGAVEYHAGGLQEPESVKAATADYEAGEDSVGRFVAEMCVTGEITRPDLRITMAALRGAYERWCLPTGDEPVSAKAFGQALRARFGVESMRSHGKKFYIGIRLDEVDDGAETGADDQGRWSW